MLPESRRIAALLLQSPTAAEWDQAIKLDNVLQKTTPSTAVRQARLIRLRLAPLGPKLWSLVAEGEREVAAQALLAAALLHSALLRDFVRTVLVGHHRRLDTHVNVHQWEPFLAERAALDPAVATWTPTTRAKLLQVILRILVEAYYLESSRSLRLKATHVHPQVKRVLHDLGHDDLIMTMELQA